MSRLVRLIPWIALLGISLASGFALRTAHFPRLSLGVFLLAGIFPVSGLTVEYWEHLRRIRLRKPWLVLPHEHDRIPQGPMYEWEIAHKEIRVFETKPFRHRWPISLVEIPSKDSIAPPL